MSQLIINSSEINAYVNDYLKNKMNQINRFYDDLIYEDDNLKLPRKEIIQYDFVLQPLVDIAPEFIHPLIKKTNKEIMDEFNIEKNIIKEIPINLDE